MLGADPLSPGAGMTIANWLLVLTATVLVVGYIIYYEYLEVDCLRRNGQFDRGECHMATPGYE